MDIQVGDVVTYKIIYSNKDFIRIISDSLAVQELNTEINNNDIEILKIERPKYEVVEEKKALLTKEEKEFLKDMCKYYYITRINFCINSIDLYNYDRVIICLDYPENIEFKNVKKYTDYTLKELGLEEK